LLPAEKDNLEKKFTSAGAGAEKKKSVLGKGQRRGTKVQKGRWIGERWERGHCHPARRKKWFKGKNWLIN